MTYLLSVRQDIVPDNETPPTLRTTAAAQSVNVEGSGQKIRIPVLKRKREKE
jgi:hypothetical protein